MACNAELNVVVHGYIKNEIPRVAMKLSTNSHRFDKLHKIFLGLSELVFTKSPFSVCVPFKHINFLCIFWSYRLWMTLRLICSATHMHPKFGFVRPVKPCAY